MARSILGCLGQLVLAHAPSASAHRLTISSVAPLSGQALEMQQTPTVNLV